MSLNNSINTAWQITARCQTLRSKRSRYQKQNDKCTDVMNCIHTQSRTFRFFTASSSIPTTVAATPILFNCSTWSFIMVSRAKQTTMIVERAPSFPFIGECVVYHRFEHRVTHWKIMLCCHITYLVSVMLEHWQNLSKLTNQRVYQILVYQSNLLLSLPIDVLLLPLTTLFLFLHAVFQTAPQLTERLEEACRPRTCGPRIRNSKHKTRAIK